MQRMVTMQLEEAKNAAKIDVKDGLETIDLSDEKASQTQTFMAAAAAEQQDPPEAQAFFRKTKSNNFFAIDDSQDQIEPFSEVEI